MQFHPRSVVAAAVAPVSVAILSLAYAFVWSYMLPVHASLKARDLHDVHVNEPVYVQFDKGVDRSQFHLTLTPKVAVALSWSGNRVAIKPKTGWTPAQTYSVKLGAISNLVHSQSLAGWHADFTTQPRVGVAAFVVDGAKVNNGVSVRLRSPVHVLFSQPMRESSVVVTVDGKRPTETWAKPDELVVVPPKLDPFGTLTVNVAKTGTTERGDEVTDGAGIRLNVLGLVPSNGSSGITPSFKTIEPILVVIENSAPARPQSGFQAADIVYEYVSEYSITRMTAIYFNQPPHTHIGPVRSCRTINLFLPFAYSGVNLCSGASSGTEHLLFSRPYVPALQDPFAPQYFFRFGANPPHNLYTTGMLALGARRQWPQPPPPYQVDPPHPDNNLGSPAPAPGVSLHHVSYSYDPALQQYLRFDSGAPFTDATTGQQLHVKNVVLIHVGYRILHYVEDESGGALSVWYDMVGSGPAEIYSDGKVIHATWHMGRAGERWSDNHQPVYFTDSQGNFIELNTGLTWIHVIGNGQFS